MTIHSGQLLVSSNICSCSWGCPLYHQLGMEIIVFIWMGLYSVNKLTVGVQLEHVQDVLPSTWVYSCCFFFFVEL